MFNGAMVDVGSMMTKLDKSDKAREEIEQKLIVLDAKMDEDTKAMGSMEQANKALSKELEEVKGMLGQTQENLKTTEELKTTYHHQIDKCASSLTSAVKELLATLGKDQQVEGSPEAGSRDQTTSAQTNGGDN